MISTIYLSDDISLYSLVSLTAPVEAQTVSSNIAHTQKQPKNCHFGHGGYGPTVLQYTLKNHESIIPK
jgi:hypothetical protein